jgi:hypothetical protein
MGFTMNGRKHGQHPPSIVKKKCICQPQMWIPKDLNDNVIILSLPYDYNVVASVHNDKTQIG